MNLIWIRRQARQLPAELYPHKDDMLTDAAIRLGHRPETVAQPYSSIGASDLVCRKE